jgi:hypothetical protein
MPALCYPAFASPVKTEIWCRRIVLLATQRDTQIQVAEVVHCPTDTVRKTLTFYRQGGRPALRRRRFHKLRTARRTLAWQKALALAMEQGPAASGTRTWMRRGEQLRVKAPGTNEKRAVSCAIDRGDGAPFWFNDRRRSGAQFCATVHTGVPRSTARGRIAVFLVDNAPNHREGRTGRVRTLLKEDAGAGSFRVSSESAFGKNEYGL